MNGAGIRVSEKYGNGIPRLDGILEAVRHHFLLFCYIEDRFDLIVILLYIWIQAEAWLPLPPMEVYSTSLRPHLLVPDQGSGKSIKSRTLVGFQDHQHFCVVLAFNLILDLK
tara:strand:- start:891 stop:1226 length:336 start_codon:yes stop_codon:yes gene_type:complete